MMQRLVIIRISPKLIQSRTYSDQGDGHHPFSLLFPYLVTNPSKDAVLVSGPGQEDVDGVDVDALRLPQGSNHAHAVGLLPDGLWVLCVGDVQRLAPLHVVGAKPRHVLV